MATTSPDPSDDTDHRTACCCFFLPCFTSNSSPSSSASWERIRTTDTGCGGEPTWWKKGLVKVKEWSELVAGPKWKTFIRSFTRNNNKAKRFQYDSTSYALNFDEGPCYDSDGEEGYLGFSARYAVLPVSAKSSMDLGGKDAAPLISSG